MIKMQNHVSFHSKLEKLNKNTGLQYVRYLLRRLTHKTLSILSPNGRVPFSNRNWQIYLPYVNIMEK